MQRKMRHNGDLTSESKFCMAGGLISASCDFLVALDDGYRQQHKQFSTSHLIEPSKCRNLWVFGVWSQAEVVLFKLEKR